MNTECDVGNGNETSPSRFGEGFQYVRVDASVGVEPNTKRRIAYVSRSPGRGRDSVGRQEKNYQERPERRVKSTVAGECAVPTPETRPEATLLAETTVEESSDEEILDITGTEGNENNDDSDDETFDLREMRRREKTAYISRSDEGSRGTQTNEDVRNENDAVSDDEYAEDALETDGMCGEATNSETY